MSGINRIPDDSEYPPLTAAEIRAWERILGAVPQTNVRPPERRAPHMSTQNGGQTPKRRIDA